MDAFSDSETGAETKEEENNKVSVSCVVDAVSGGSQTFGVKESVEDKDSENGVETISCARKERSSDSASSDERLVDDDTAKLEGKKDNENVYYFYQG